MVVVTIKSFQHKTFKIEIEDSKKIIDLKRKIEDERGPSLPASALKLVYSGKVLSNNALISDYKLQKKNSFVVAIVSKSKHSKTTSARGNSGIPVIGPGEGLNSATPLIATVVAPPTAMSSSTTNTTTAPSSATTSASSNLTSVPMTAIVAAETNTSSQQTEVSAAPGALGESDGQASGSFVNEVSTSLVTGLEYDRVVAELMSLGYERNLVIQALRVSFNNPNRAAEYLMQRQSHQEPPSHNMLQPIRAGMTMESVPLGDDPQEEGHTQGREELLAAFRTPELAPLLQHLRENRSLFPTFLTTLQQTNPELFSLIQDNHRAFIQLCNAPAPTNHGAPPSQPAATPNQHHITITPEEKEAIERLKALGFSEVMVIQAYFACDKNEDLAANFLFSNIDDAAS